MNICEKCKKEFKIRVNIDGKVRNLNNRKFCLDCSPFGRHNTSKFPDLAEGDKDARRKAAAVRKVVRYRQRRKMKLVDHLGAACNVCGYNKRIPDAYAFHHIDPEHKDFTISENYGKSMEKIYKEIKKCELLCVLCHAEKHFQMRNDD